MRGVLVLALLAGCASPASEGVDSAAATIELDDFVLDMLAEPIGPSIRLSGTILNNGTTTYDFKHGCHHEWRFEIRHGSRILDPGVNTCDGFQEGTFGPGETTRFGFQWDGSYFENGKKQQAAPGLYKFHLDFYLDFEADVTISGQLPFRFEP